MEPGAKELIWDRAQQAECHGYHGNSKLFRWAGGNGKGALVRRKVAPYKAALVWGEYPPSQRIYCAVYDEWDVCVEFSIATSRTHLAWHEAPQEASSGSEEGTLDGVGHDTSALTSGELPSAAAAETLEDQMHSRADPEELFPPLSGHAVSSAPEQGVTVLFTPPDTCQSDSEDVDDPRTAQPHCDWKQVYMGLFPADKRRLYRRTLRGIPSLQQVLTEFYGIWVPRSLLMLGEDQATSVNSCGGPEAESFLRRVACSHPLSGEVLSFDASTIAALIGLCDHISWYARAEDVFQQPDPTVANGWLDVNVSHPAYVLRNVPSGVTVTAVQWRLCHDSTYQIRLPNIPLLVQLFRATDVLWFLRQLKTRRAEEAIVRLATYGMKFSLAVRAPSIPRETMASGVTVPWRRLPFRANAIDYDQYLLRRARLLASKSVLRAALMCGGIVWRLAMEHCADPEIVLSCSAEEIQHSPCYNTTSSGEAISEIALSKTEVDIIVGVYSVSKQCPPPKKCQEVSWFPRQGHFNRGGLGVGFWSEDAESWYQDRVHGYLTGSEQPVAQSDWAQRMKLHKPAGRFSKGYEQLARVKLFGTAGTEA